MQTNGDSHQIRVCHFSDVPRQKNADSACSFSENKLRQMLTDSDRGNTLTWQNPMKCLLPSVCAVWIGLEAMFTLAKYCCQSFIRMLNLAVVKFEVTWFHVSISKGCLWSQKQTTNSANTHWQCAVALPKNHGLNPYLHTEISDSQTVIHLLWIIKILFFGMPWARRLQCTDCEFLKA